MPDHSRRAFLRGQVGQIQSARSILRPPWSLPEQIFIDHCTRCGDCIDACPQKILQIGEGGYPEVNFQYGTGECSFCESCAACCKESAFLPVQPNPRSIENAWDIAVHIDASKCLAVNHVVCQICGDVCDTQAIRFQLQIGGMAIPKFEAEHCTGCGVCIHGCPVQAVSVVFPTQIP